MPDLPSVRQTGVTPDIAATTTAAQISLSESRRYHAAPARATGGGRIQVEHSRTGASVSATRGSRHGDAEVSGRIDVAAGIIAAEAGERFVAVARIDLVLHGSHLSSNDATSARWPQCTLMSRRYPAVFPLSCFPVNGAAPPFWVKSGET
jgi:hypothetical protein